MFKRKLTKKILAIVMMVALSISYMPTYSAYAAGSKAVGKVKIKSAKASGQKIAIKWKKVKGAAGYKAVVAKTKKGKQVVYKKNVKKTKVTTKALAAGKYFVRVRAFAKINGKKVWGKWSKSKKIVITVKATEETTPSSQIETTVVVTTASAETTTAKSDSQETTIVQNQTEVNNPTEANTTTVQQEQTTRINPTQQQPTNPGQEQTTAQPTNSGQEQTTAQPEQTTRVNPTQQQPTNPGQEQTTAQPEQTTKVRPTQQQPTNPGEEQTTNTPEQTTRVRPTQQQPTNPGQEQTTAQPEQTTRVNPTQQQPTNPEQEQTTAASTDTGLNPSTLSYTSIQCSGSENTVNPIEYSIYEATMEGIVPWYGDAGNTFMIQFADPTGEGNTSEVTVNGTAPASGVVTEQATGLVKVNPNTLPDNSYTVVTVTLASGKSATFVIKKGSPSSESVTTTQQTSTKETTQENVTIPDAEIPSATEANTSEENTASWDDEETSAADTQESWNKTDVLYVTFSQSAVTVAKADGTEVSGTGVTLKDGVLKMTVPATYVLQGSMTDGSIQLKSGEGEYNVILNGVNVTSNSTAAFYATKKATKVVMTLAQGTTNVFKGPSSYTFAEGEDEPDAALFVKKALTINGSGSLQVTDPNGDAIKCKDVLKIAEGNITVNAGDDGIIGKDALAVAGGTINVTAGGDGMKTNLQTDTSLGYVDISGGNITVVSGADGIQADTTATIANATVNVTTKYNSGTANDSFKGIKAGGTITVTGTDGTTTSSLMGLVHIKSGNITLNTVEDAIKSKKDMLIEGGRIVVESYSDAIQADYNLTISGSSTYINVTTHKNSSYSFIDSYKGLKAGISEDTATGTSAEGTLLIKDGTIIVDTTPVGTTSERGNTKGDDALHSNNILQIDGGNFTLKAGDDGIHSDKKLVINGGQIEIPSSYEGIESYEIYLEGGTVNVVSSDDGVNAAGGNDGSGNAGGNNPWQQPGGGFGSSSTGFLYIDGGTYTFAIEGDGLDSNGDIYMTGGTVYVYGPTSGGNGIFDYGDNGNQFVKSGGTLIGAGTSDMAVYPTCTTGAVCKYSVSGSANKACSITTGSKTYNFTPTKSYQLVMISTSEMTSGTTYTLTYNGNSTASAQAATSISGGSGGPGGGGPGGGGPGGW